MTEPDGAMSEAHTASHRVPTLIVRGDTAEKRADAVVGEEPLQIRACGPGQDPTDVAITMRTPGSEDELALGFLLAEGLVTASDVHNVTFELGDPMRLAQPHDEILVRLPRTLDLAAVAERHFVATASCGVCGRASVDELEARVERFADGLRIGRSALQAMPNAMRNAQAVFEHTGGLHAAALFEPDGAFVALREDVGRHNAVDKLVGSRALAGALPAAGLPEGGLAMLVSGRVSFEIIQKAAVAHVPVVAAVSAPSDLAVATAERLGMTLVGFLRGDGFNVYAGAERIDLAD